MLMVTERISLAFANGFPKNSKLIKKKKQLKRDFFKTAVILYIRSVSTTQYTGIFKPI